MRGFARPGNGRAPMTSVRRFTGIASMAAAGAKHVFEILRQASSVPESARPAALPPVRDRATIAIAHRLSTLRRADRLHFAGRLAIVPAPPETRAVRASKRTRTLQGDA